MINMLQSDNKSSAKAQVPTKSVLIGKAWVKEDKSFAVAPLTEPVEGKKGEYQISGVYPMIITEYCSISFGPNTKMVDGKNHNTHWVFLRVEEAKLDEYVELLKKIGQEFSESK